MSLTVVLFHHVAPAESDWERGLGVTIHPDAFRAQVDWLARRYAVVGLDAVLSGDLPRRALLITFDDAYPSVLAAARAELAPRGLPSVFFVNPDLLGPDAPALDNVLAWIAARHGLAALREAMDADAAEAPDLGRLIGSVASRLGSGARAALRDRLRARFGIDRAATADRPFLVPGDLAALQAAGVEIGNHTASHVHCRALDAVERAAELDGARARLEALAGRPVRAFAVPYGSAADLTPPVLDALRASGHRAIFLVQARSNRLRPAPDVWYRVSLAGAIPPAALGRKLGLMPALRSARALVSGRR